MIRSTGHRILPRLVAAIVVVMALGSTTYPEHSLAATAAPAAQRPALAAPGFVFPFPEGVEFDRAFSDNYGEGRSWSPGGKRPRPHLGIDISAPEGTPLVAVGAGRIVRFGWSQYAGWRLTIALDGAPGYSIHYAHLSAYAGQLGDGVRVKAGQLIGYVGNTGYGPAGTKGRFAPHLHLGIYRSDSTTINPYPFLKVWEANRVSLSPRSGNGK